VGSRATEGLEEITALVFFGLGFKPLGFAVAFFVIWMHSGKQLCPKDIHRVVENIKTDRPESSCRVR
jgi:hypothetical protein